jgi:hypothetical protein
VSAAGTGWSRREFAGGIAFLALALGVPAAAIKLTDLDPQEAPTDRQRRLMAMVSDLVIPRTDTPGAKDAGVGDFVILALAHGLDGTRAPMAGASISTALDPYRRRDGSLRYLNWLESTLDHVAGGDFPRHGREQCARWLEKLDADAFAEGSDFSPWKPIKGLILTGYYTSEVGGSRELRYELDPGKWEPNLPLTPEMRAYSSDWTAVDFG